MCAKKVKLKKNTPMASSFRSLSLSSITSKLWLFSGTITPRRKAIMAEETPRLSPKPDKNKRIPTIKNGNMSSFDILSIYLKLLSLNL